MDIKKPKFEKRPIEAESDEPEVEAIGPEEFKASLKPKMTEGGVEVAWLNIGLFLLVIIVASLAAYFAYTKLSSNSNNTATSLETPTPEPTASPEASPSPSPTPAATPTVAPTTAAAATDTVPAKSDLKISVLNGNGTRGQAAIIAAKIRQAGYAHVTYGNAASYTYKTTLITYKAGRKAVAEDIASVLSDRSTSLEERQISLDVQVILGKN